MSSHWKDDKETLVATQIKNWLEINKIAYHCNIPVLYNGSQVGKCDYVIPNACILVKRPNYSKFEQFVNYFRTIIPETHKVHIIKFEECVIKQLDEISYEEYPLYIGQYSKLRTFLDRYENVANNTSIIYYDQRALSALKPEEVIKLELLKGKYKIESNTREHIVQRVEFTKPKCNFMLTNCVVPHKMFNVLYSNVLSSYVGHIAEKTCEDLLKQQNVPYHSNVTIQYEQGNVLEFDFIIPNGCIEVKSMHDNVSVCIFIKKCTDQIERQIQNMPPGYTLYFYLPYMDERYITEEMRNRIEIDPRVKLISGNHEFVAPKYNYYINNQKILDHIVHQFPESLRGEVIFISTELDHKNLFNCSFDYVIGKPNISIVLDENIIPVRKVYNYVEFPNLFKEYVSNSIDIEYVVPEKIVHGVKYNAPIKSLYIKKPSKTMNIIKNNVYEHFIQKCVPVKFIKLKFGKNSKEFVLVPGALICYSTVESLNHFTRDTIQKLKEYVPLIPNNIQLYIYFVNKFDYSLSENNWDTTFTIINSIIPNVIMIDNLDDVKIVSYSYATRDKRALSCVIKHNLPLEYVSKNIWDNLSCYVEDVDYKVMNLYNIKFIASDINLNNNCMFYVSSTSSNSQTIESKYSSVYYNFETKLVEGNYYVNKQNEKVKLQSSLFFGRDHIPQRVIEGVSYQCHCGNITLTVEVLCPCHLKIFSPTEEKRRMDGKECWNDHYVNGRFIGNPSINCGTRGQKRFAPNDNNKIKRIKIS